MGAAVTSKRNIVFKWIVDPGRSRSVVVNDLKILTSEIRLPMPLSSAYYVLLLQITDSLFCYSVL